MRQKCADVGKPLDSEKINHMEKMTSCSQVEDASEVAKSNATNPKNMKLDIKTNLLIIESTDLYFYEVSQRWVPVPKFWVGDFIQSYSHKIKSQH